MRIEIKNRFNGNVIFSHECDNNTIAITVTEAVKSSADISSADLSFADLSFADLSSANLRYANLSSADLSFADLRYANLSSADLSFADLSFADLSSANLRYANLSSADLSSANLSFAITDKKYCSINCIGSVKRMTTYCFEDDIIWCGCFKGSLKEFTAKVKDTHANNPQYLKEYLNFIKYLKSIK